MAKLGDRVLFRVAENHRTKTVKGGEELAGSIYHPEMTEFVGIVGRVHVIAKAQFCDLQLLIPNADPKWVGRVAEGDEPGEFELLEAPAKK